MRKIVSIILCVALLLATCLSFSSCSVVDFVTRNIENLFSQDAKNYDKALELLESGDYEEAKALFEELGDYKDSKTYLSKFYYMPISFEYDLVDKKSTNDVTYNDKNLPSSEITLREDVHGISEFVYDDNGNIIKQIATNKTEGTVSSFEYAYDNNGNRTSAYYTSEDGLHALYTFEYDSEGRLIVQNYEDDDFQYEYRITYDENGIIIKEDQSYGGETYTCNTEYELDENGRVSKKTSTYPNNAQEHVEYTYDEKGNEIQIVYTDYNGSKTTYDYTYDNYGNVIEEVCTDPDGYIQYVKTKYILLYIPTGITKGTETFFIDFWATRL